MFRVTLECICVLVYLNLLPARCLCASPWFQARWYCPPPGSHLETPEAAAWPGLSSISVSRGRRRSAKLPLQPLRAEAGPGTARDGAGLGASLPQPPKYFISSRKGN